MADPRQPKSRSLLGKPSKRTVYLPDQDGNIQLGTVDLPGYDGVLDGATHDQVDGDPEHLLELIPQREVGLHPRVRLHGGELDKKVDIALTLAEVSSKNGTEHVKPAHTVTPARGTYLAGSSFEQWSHEITFRERSLY